MIIEVVKETAQFGQTTIDVVINPANVLLQLMEAWKLSIGVPHYSVIKAGYWMRHGAGRDFERARLASREEIIQNDAFYTMLDISTDLY